MLSLIDLGFNFILIFMVLFWAAISRDSLPVFRFPFRGHVRVFWCAISLVCRYKYPYSCFSFPFLFPNFCYFFFFVFMLLMLLFVAVISLSLLFSMQSTIPCVDVSTQSSMLASLLPTTFLDTYSVSYLSIIKPCAKSLSCPLVHLSEFLPCPS